MKKIFQDTLMKNGKFDKQALTFFASFLISCVLGISNTIASYVLQMPNNPTADNVFNAFMTLTGVLSGANIANKIADATVKKKESENTSTE
jgi:hypothetical protein